MSWATYLLLCHSYFCSGQRGLSLAPQPPLKERQVRLANFVSRGCSVRREGQNLELTELAARGLAVCQ